MDKPGKVQQQKTYARADKRNKDRQDGPGGPLPPGRLWESGPKGLLQKRDELAHEHHGMSPAQGVPQQAIQQEA